MLSSRHSVTKNAFTWKAFLQPTPRHTPPTPQKQNQHHIQLQTHHYAHKTLTPGTKCNNRGGGGEKGGGGWDR